MAGNLSRRQFLRVGLGALGFTALAACTAPVAAPSGDQAAAPGQAQKELGFAWWTGGEGANKVFEAAIDRFEAKYPEYTVNRITSPGGQEFHTKLLTMYGAGNAPACHGLQWGPVWAFAHRGILADLTPFVERDAAEVKLDEMWPAITAMLNYPSGSNTMVALPRETFGMYMRFYNKGIFAEAGVETPEVDYDAGNWTWEVWREKAAACTKFDASGRREIMGARQAADLWQLAYVMPSLGVSMFSDDLAHFNLDDPAVQQWLQMVQDMTNVDKSIGSPAETEEFDWGSSGKLAIDTDATWAIPNMIETWADIEWDFVPPPKGAGGHANLPGCDFHAVNGSEGADQEGGWTLIKFLNSPEEDLWWATNMYGPPFRQPNLETWIAQVSEGLPLNGWKYIGDMMASAKPWPTVPFFLELDTIHANEIGQALTAERTVEDVTTSIATQAEAMIADFE